MIEPKAHFFWLAIAFLFMACNPELPKVFQEQQELHYSTAWEKLDNYPLRFGRNDDLFFFSPDTGFVINSQGSLFLTEDGGNSWQEKFQKKRTFFRCLSFQDRQTGWLGTLGTGDEALRSVDTIALYETFDGGENWQPTVFDGPYPKGLCGLQRVTDQMTVGCGRVRGPSFFIKTTDGGQSWQSYDLNHVAGSLIAPYFYDEQHGILIGGTTTDKKNCRSLILETFDGGYNWDTLYISQQKGEYCWKVSFPSPNRGFISIQRNLREGRFYFLETRDGGKSWQEKEYTEGYYYVQGIGFMDEKTGWMGGSDKWTMETRDGGQSWRRMSDVGLGFNKFQFFGDSLAYGVGFGVFKMKGPKALPKGKVVDYYDNGRVRSRLSYQDGIRQGSAKFYFENGQLKSQGRMKKNWPHGNWQFFTEQGELIHKLKYRYGSTRIPQKDLAEYAGTYRVREGVDRKIRLEKGKLFSTLSSSGQTFEIFPISDREFVYEHDRFTKVEFVRDQNGKVTHHILKTRNNARKAQKIQ